MWSVCSWVMRMPSSRSGVRSSVSSELRMRRALKPQSTSTRAPGVSRYAALPPLPLPKMVNRTSSTGGSVRRGGEEAQINFIHTLAIARRGLWNRNLVWKKEVLESIDLKKIRSNGYSFQIEMNFRSWRKGFNIIEHPIIFIDRTIGESKMSKSIMYEAVFVVWRLRIWKLFGWNK